MEVSCQLQTPAALPPGKKPPQYPLDWKLGGPWSWSGHCGVEKILTRKSTNSDDPEYEIFPGKTEELLFSVAIRYLKTQI
jgi:hypothetical protein